MTVRLTEDQAAAAMMFGETASRAGIWTLLKKPLKDYEKLFNAADDSGVARCWRSQMSTG